jgi:predicted metal-binding membrane protein
MQRGALAATALLFAASVAGTIYLCGSMSGGMPMPGGWTMSMTWMRMPGQTWPAAAAMFLAMWFVMMVAMMLPSLAAMLWSYPTDLRGFLAVSGAYFLVWTIAGIAVYPAGLALAAAEMRWPPLSRALPLAGGTVLIVAGIVQLTPWKARQLGVCRNPMACATSWQHGLHFGRHCALCCTPLMAALLVLGVMNLWVMLAVAIAITVERVAPRPVVWARVTGAAILAIGSVLLLQTSG